VILAMRPGRRWLVWFLLGNCFVPYGIYSFAVYETETPQVAEFSVPGVAPGGGFLRVRVGAGWDRPERNRRKIWRWALRPEASIILSNSGTRPIEADLNFATISFQPEDLRVKVRDAVVWSGHLDGKNTLTVQTAAFALPPGETVVSLATPQPPTIHDPDDGRALTFMLTGLQLTEEAAAPAAAR